MSYSRWSESDLYLFADVGGGMRCMCCKLLPEPDDPCTFCPDSHLWSLDDTIQHVREHQKAGHDAPEAIIERLEADRDWLQEHFREIPRGKT